MRTAIVAHKGQRVILNSDATGNVTPNINTLKNISQIASGQAFTIQLPVGTAGKFNRKLAVKLFCQAVNYTGGNNMATAKLTGAGAGATVQIVPDASHLPQINAITAGGAGYAVGDKFSVVGDATGSGAQFQVTAVNAGAITAASYIAGSAIATPCDPSFVVINPKVAIGTATPFNVDSRFFAMRRQAVGLKSPLGELSLDFADPARNFLRNNDITSWDTVGAGSMQITGTINALAVNPSVSGIEIWDERRNSYVNAKGQTVVFANPFAYVQQPITLVSGQVNINNLTPKGKISRLWIKADNAGTISQLQITADGKVRLEGNVADQMKQYRAYGFRFASVDSFEATNYATSNAIQAAANPFSFFDAAWIPDYEQREGDANAISSFTNLVLQVTATQAGNATVYMECLPGGFA